MDLNSLLRRCEERIMAHCNAHGFVTNEDVDLLNDIRAFIKPRLLDRVRTPPAGDKST